MKIDMPVPPSTNNLFVSVGRRRVVSPQYAAWRVPVIQLLRIRRLRVQRYPVRIVVHVYGGTNVDANRDLDNFLKAPIDALKKGGVIKDDNLGHVCYVAAEYHPPQWKDYHPGRIVVEIIEPDIDTGPGPDTIVPNRPPNPKGVSCPTVSPRPRKPRSPR